MQPAYRPPRDRDAYATIRGYVYQIDRTVDLTFVPNALAGANFSGQFRPRPLFKQSDLAVNGIQVGLDWRW